MTGHLDEALRALLVQELPDLFGGGTPPVRASVSAVSFELDPSSIDALGGEPRSDDRVDTLTFDAAQPAGPYTLAQPPDSGPRRVRLATTLGDRIALTTDEVQFDALDSRRFSLSVRPDRELTGVNAVQVLYGVTAVFIKLKYFQELTLVLEAADAARLDTAEAMAVAVVALNRAQLTAAGAHALEEADYGATIDVKSLRLLKGTAPGPTTRQLHFRAELELKASRALAADEGMPIRRIHSPGLPAAPGRPVDIRIDVEA